MKEIDVKEEISGAGLTWRIIRGGVLLLLTTSFTYVAILSALEGEWERGIFFLLAATITDKSLDKVYEG